jgi:hypothetical protein
MGRTVWGRCFEIWGVEYGFGYRRQILTSFNPAAYTHG